MKRARGKRIPLIDLLVRRFPDTDREELLASILCGEVYSPRGRHPDPKELIAPETELRLQTKKYVSRAGQKLEAALSRWAVPVAGRRWLDAGASTGGFTDCLLQNGALLVHTVDVGYNQLAWSLRNDPRVVVHERTNAGSVGTLDPVPDAAVTDLSFRSLRGILRQILELTSQRWGIALLKPQFELAHDIRSGLAGDALPGGVVRDSETIRKVVRSVRSELEKEMVDVIDAIPSPVRGRRGNQEYLLLVKHREGAALPHVLNVSRVSGDPI